jgi:hypothetical protein
MFELYLFSNKRIKIGTFFIINYLNYNTLINFLYMILNFSTGICQNVNNK